jgi:hypothetical protein
MHVFALQLGERCVISFWGHQAVGAISCPHDEKWEPIPNKATSPSVLGLPGKCYFIQRPRTMYCVIDKCRISLDATINACEKGLKIGGRMTYHLLGKKLD